MFLGNPDQGECDVTIAWHIDKEHFDDTSSDGLNVLAVFHTPGNMFTGPKWKGALYLDERATKEQADALGKIYSGKAGGFFAVIAGFIGETYFLFKKIDYYSSLIFGHNINFLITFLQRARKIP